MSKSSNRRVYVAVLGVAVAGFIVDRTFLAGSLGPESASAAAVEPVSVSTPASRESEQRLSERVAAAFEEAAADAALQGVHTPDLFDPTLVLGSREEPENAARRRIEDEYLRTRGLQVLSDRAWKFGDRTVLLDQHDPMIGHYRVTGTFEGAHKGERGGIILTKGDSTIRVPYGQTIQPERFHE